MSVRINFLRNSFRTYTRWVSRRPSKILEPKHLKEFESIGKVELEEYNKLIQPKPIKSKDLTREYLDTKQENVTELSLEDIERNEEDDKESMKTPKKIKSKKSNSNPSKSLSKQNQIIVDEATNIEYEKLKMGDAKFSSIMVFIKSRKERLKSNQILLEGRRLIQDGLEAGLKLHKLMFSKVEYLAQLEKYLKMYDKDPNCLFYKVAYSDMTLWSDLKTNPGIMGLFSRPPLYYIPQNVDVSFVPITVICDNIREPSNLGSVIRTCAAIPCHQLLLMKGCVDPWDSKVLRSASGGHFRLSLLDDIVWTNIKEHLPEKCKVFIADSNTDAPELRLPIEAYDKVDFIRNDNAHTVLIIGGETEGISSDAYQFANYFNGQRVHIPIAKGVDSLNVGSALSVLTFEIRRQLLK